MSKPFVPLSTISDDEILSTLRDIVAKSLRVDPARITPDASLDALGAESIDIVEMTMDLEHAFTVLMPEHSILQLGNEVAGPGVFERDGVLTDRGARLLRARMPEIDQATFVEGTSTAAIAPMFLRIDAWMRVVRGLLEATPRTCDTCGGRLVQGTPGRARCPSCARELDLPTGDALGREWIRRWLQEHP